MQLAYTHKCCMATSRPRPRVECGIDEAKPMNTPSLQCCPYIWRVYKPSSNASADPAPYKFGCYNCASADHFGGDCPRPRGHPLKDVDPSAFTLKAADNSNSNVEVEERDQSLPSIQTVLNAVETAEDTQNLRREKTEAEQRARLAKIDVRVARARLRHLQGAEKKEARDALRALRAGGGAEKQKKSLMQRQEEQQRGKAGCQQSTVRNEDDRPRAGEEEGEASLDSDHRTKDETYSFQLDGRRESNMDSTQECGHADSTATLKQSKTEEAPTDPSTGNDSS